MTLRGLSADLRQSRSRPNCFFNTQKREVIRGLSEEGY